jgi:hypothetical protein
LLSCVSFLSQNNFMKNFSLRFMFVFAGLLLGLTSNRASAQYCTPEYFQGCTLGGALEDFALTGVSSSISDLATGCTSTMGTGFPPAYIAYLDHSTMSVTLNPASTYTVVAKATVVISGAPNGQIFIDFNDNFNFTDPGESVGGGVFNVLTSTNFPITIPAGVSAGTHRMRIVVSGSETYPAVAPCPTSTVALNGETHDYSVYITGTSTTCAPVTGLGISGITSSTATVSWTAVTGAIGYEWAVTTSSTPPAAGTFTTTTSVGATGLTPSTTYYAHVRTKCGATSFSTWVTTTAFTTLAAPTTCDPVTSVTMSSVTSGSAILNWAAVTGAIGYEWAVTTSATAPASGTATTLTTATASGLSAATAYYAHVRTKCSSTLFSSWVSTPFTTSAASSCPAITGLTATAITGTGATVSWTAVTSGSVGYQYVIDNIVTDPTGSGTNTTATSTSPTSLTAGTTYYAHVRDSCGVGNFSPWSTIPFTTLSSICNAVTGLTASAITASGATLNWTMASGAVASQYVVDNVASDPTISGTTTTASTAAITGLSASTTYYAHVRDSCGVAALSAWVTIPLTTLGTTGIANVNNGAGFGISAYPNPVRGELTIQISGNSSNNGQLVVTDIAGKVITTAAVTGTSVTLDLNNVPAGLYLVRYTDSVNTRTLKVSKQ